jgi:hypothetical protein
MFPTTIVNETDAMTAAALASVDPMEKANNICWT